MSGKRIKKVHLQLHEAKAAFIEYLVRSNADVVTELEDVLEEYAERLEKKLDEVVVANARLGEFLKQLNTIPRPVRPPSPTSSKKGAPKPPEVYVRRSPPKE